MLRPLFIYQDDLKEAGLTNDQVFEACNLLHSAFGEKFWDDLDTKFLSTYKNSVWKHFGVHKIYRWITAPIIADKIYLIAVADCFSLFRNEASIQEYISRLKIAEQVEATLFELFLARFFHQEGSRVSLQKKGLHGNPVDLLIEKDGQEVWIECKSFFIPPDPEPYGDMFLRKLTDDLRGAPSNTAFGIESFAILGGSALRRALNITADVIKMSHNIPTDKTPLRIDTFFGYVGVYKTEITEDFMKFFTHTYYPVLALSYAPADEVTGGVWPKIKGNIRSLKTTRTKVLGVRHPHIPYSKKLRDPEKIIRDIGAKVDQQKTLMDAGQEVWIILDSLPSKEEPRISAECIRKFSKYPKLSIEVARDKVDKDLVFNYQPIVSSPTNNLLSIFTT